MLVDEDKVNSTGVEEEEVGRPEWVKRKEKFVELVQEIRRVFEKICCCSNWQTVFAFN